jgi:hypothetical protein
MIASPDIAALVEEARAATPRPGRERRNKARWAALWPVVRLLRERGYTYDQAVDWLVERAAMEGAERERAKRAFWQIAHRRNRRERAGGDSRERPAPTNNNQEETNEQT